MRLFDDRRLQRTGTLNRRGKIAHFEPEQHAMSGWRRVPVHQIAMILLLPGMELKDQLAAAEDSIIKMAVFVFRQ